MRYTIIGYKPDSSDYCRGCHMASYSSDFQLYSNLTKKEAIEKYADLIFSNGFLEYNEDGYEITILTDGKELDSPEIYNEGYELGNILIDKRKQEIELEKQRAEELRQSQILESKRQKLEQLKKELGE